MSFVDRVRAARESGNLDDLIETVPFMHATGMEMKIAAGDVLGIMRFSEPLIGNFSVRALHGGTLGALLESTAAFKLIWDRESETVPRIVNITVQYLRGGKDRDTFARAEITKLGRRVASVRAVAWQDDPEKPVAAAQTHFLIGEG